MDTELREIRVGDRLLVECPDEPHLSCIVTVTKICGDGDPDDIIKFDDFTHIKRKQLADFPRVRD